MVTIGCIPNLQTSFSSEAEVEFQHGAYSVHSPLQAERDVMTVLNALCKPGGRVHVSGRSKERLRSLSRGTLQSDSDQRFGPEALDKDGMVATYRGDIDASDTAWTFQKFHSKAEAIALASTIIGPVERYTHSSTSWQITARKAVSLPPAAIEAALRREFDLPLPGGQRFGMADAVVRALKQKKTYTS